MKSGSVFLVAVAGVVAGLITCQLSPAQDWPEAEESERIVVTATRTEEKVEDVASSVTVIASEEIDQTQVKTVGDALRDVPAVTVARNGPAGGVTSVFVRGAKSEHTLVLVDGIEVNDPISPSRGTDLAHLTLDNVERIEIIRGPQSTLYGSDAIGGVVNVITKKGEGRPSSFVSIEGGSYNSLRVSAGAGGASGITNYSLTASNFRTDGFSAASDGLAGNTEADGYMNTTFAARAGADFSEEFGVECFLRYTEAWADVDNGGGAGKDDPNNTVDTKQADVGARARFTSLDGSFEQKITLSLNDLKRVNDNPVDAAHPQDLVDSSYEGLSVKGGYQGDLRLGEASALTFGVEVEDERGSGDYYSESMFGPYESKFDEESASTYSLYVQDQMKALGNLNATVGLRVDRHDDFGSAVTYRATAGYRIAQSDTRIRATVGTGFKAPSLYQLYDAANGNLGLEPEESASWDFGVEQELPNQTGSISVTWFRNDFTDLIDWFLLDPMWFTGEYRNIAEAESEGVELLASVKASANALLNASYTYCRTQDNVTGAPLLRRPQHKYTLSATYRLAERGSVNLGVTYVSDRLDETGYPPVPVTLGEYAMVSLAANYAVSDSIAVTGRVENLLDAEYEEVYGYGAPGRSFYLGVRATF